MFIFISPSPSESDHGGISEHVVRRRGTDLTIILLTGAVGGSGGFSFPLLAPRENCLHRFQTPGIGVFVIMLEVVVADIAVVGLATLNSLTTLSLDLTIFLDLVPSPIVIYPPLPAPYSFNLNFNSIPVPGIDRHQILDRPRTPSLLRFNDGLVFLLGVSIITVSARV